MSISTKLQSEFSQLKLGSATVVTVEHDGRRLVCDFDEVQTLACKVHEICLHADSLKNASLEQLRSISDKLATQLNYLLEPIGPIEQDADQCVVQMRSMPPAEGEDGRSYYELLVRRGSLLLCRFQKQPASIRERIPAVLTQQVLVRLAGDLDAAVDG